MLLLGYLPINSSQRTSVLLHKRSQYRDLVKKHLPGQDRNLTFVFKQISTASASASSNNINSNNNFNNNDGVFSSSWDDNNSYYQQFNQHFKNPSSKLFSSMVNLVNINKAKNYEELVQQVHVDVIRTRPDGFVPLFETPEIEKMLERILMIWSIENADISYFQGLNDLVCPLLLVFLEHEVNQLNHSNSSSYPSISQLLEQTSSPASPYTQSTSNKSSWSTKLEKLLGEGLILKELKECGQADVVLSRVEADVYWCISLLMNTVKHYAQGTGCGLPAEGMMRRLEALVRESNGELYKHLKTNDIDFSHFSFRWMVCFLTRDFDLETGVKLWDHYFCDRENQGFSLLHICFCSSLLNKWTPDLLTKDFMELVQYLQKPPSLQWNSTNLESIFRSSYLLKEKYKNILL
ncbi:hypothetical protein DICPUDRAFT_95594 [Dictyostelium purpureum]|uniref:Rab-GAP TBC domain-containing protein n=1 Tax=Dictyostelium purpureum TaxID=5786 RepID=F0ZY75_DICPU|nr:uncharacterized protein DICPUDRAFT_95594 [Dictyostelium purpureum]EGC31092.1 hypothetical protein DICPUDRAFT_95594 [Dictyostelium purpureum]|eukprot:XP_003292369.1 hypothetical protein DICPUDRAFT_95594 [Dictyostelium purpureum]